MGKVSCSLTVYFEDPFWVGVFEVVENNKVSASRVVFGAEQTGPEDQKPRTERGRGNQSF